MVIKFKELYEMVNDTKLAIDMIGLDIDNVSFSPETLCILTAEQKRVAQSFMELSNTSVTLKNIDIDELQYEVNACMEECIKFIK